LSVTLSPIAKPFGFSIKRKRVWVIDKTGQPSFQASSPSAGAGTIAGSKEILMVKFLMMSEDFATNTALSTDPLYKSENFVLNNQQHLKGGK
jgi:hypothetical protein